MFRKVLEAIPTTKKVAMSRLKRSERSALPKTQRGEYCFLVMYDTPHDSLRDKLSTVCLEHGLTRVQQSCFMGCIKDKRAQELWIKLMTLSGVNLSAQRPQYKKAKARVSILRLDQGQLWPSAYVSSPVTELILPEDALQPKSPDQFLVSVA